MYLSSGDVMQDIALSFRVGISTARMAVRVTCRALWSRLQPLYMPKPETASWLKIAEGFGHTWQFPNCLGAVDGKHVHIKCPAKSGSMYFNYKGTYSIVLLAVVDSNYKFVVVDVGANGKQSDWGLLEQSIFGQLLDKGKLQLPRDLPLPNTALPAPCGFIGDEAFQLRTDFLRPYPGRGLEASKRVFNCHLSRARRSVENAFGILVTRWRILGRPMGESPENAEQVVKALFRTARRPNTATTQVLDKDRIKKIGLMVVSKTGHNRKIGEHVAQFGEIAPFVVGTYRLI
ncbi:uncharacterized protein [Dermacentor albipictus]|uniref:uncharacterized protein n=1 Tax=Dermacentor albipictus TaxID=60249 RepID=UPI0038FD21EF